MRDVASDRGRHELACLRAPRGRARAIDQIEAWFESPSLSQSGEPHDHPAERRLIVPHQSGLTPASFTTFAHFAISDF